MPESENAPDVEQFYGLYEGVFKAHLVSMALELDLFTALHEAELDSRSLAEAVGASESGVARLADYLVAIELLVKSGNRYGLTPTARAFLVRTSKAYAGDLLRGFTVPVLWDGLGSSLRSGVPADLLERFDQDAWVESYRTSRFESSLRMWRAAGVTPTRGAEVRILDLACGCGIKSLCLAQTEPTVSVVCVDRPEVLASARDLAERMGVGRQARFVAADLLSLDLGVGLYEACLAGQITHYLTADQNEKLFRRIHRALVDGGRFVVDVPMGGLQPDEQAAFLSLMLWANSGGTTFTYEEYRALLLASGFRDVRRLGGRWLVAWKAA